MGVTNLDNINSLVSRAKVGTNANLPTTPGDYYGSTVQDFESRSWKGGELYFSSDNLELHVQTATSGVAATWRKLDTSFNTTTSTSTTTSSTSSSSSTSTSTSSSSSTSSSTSTSSTTTA